MSGIIEWDQEQAISFIQVGAASKATRFFKSLDNQLQDVGAKLDIVDRVTVDEMKNMTLKDVLLNPTVD